jgi:hypothetical protein
MLKTPKKSKVPFQQLEFLGADKPVDWVRFTQEKFLLSTKVSLLAVALRVANFRLNKIRSTMCSVAHLGTIKKILESR